MTDAASGHVPNDPVNDPVPDDPVGRQLQEELDRDLKTVGLPRDSWRSC